jgi:hypothetical protein
MTESSIDSAPSQPPVFSIRNSGDPIKLTGVQLNGFSAEAGQPGETVQVFTRLWLTSDDPLFHRIAGGLSNHIAHLAQQAGRGVDLARAHTALLVVHADNSADLWVDTAAVTVQIMAKRDMVPGRAVFESDIADVIGMAFPMVDIGRQDRVVCIFREGWRFGFFFDGNPDGDLSVENMQRDLGTMHRRMKYRELYDAVADNVVFTRLIDAGWFPFVEMIGPEFRLFADHCAAGFDLAGEEAKLIAKFDPDRLDRMFKRWMAKPHFAAREALLKPAIKAFLDGEAVPAIKIVLTEIEGILSDAYRAAHGSGAKIQTLLDFAIASAEQKAGQSESLLFPIAFAHYLRSHTFSNFDPTANTGNANSRHAVGHGAAPASSYTLVRALQAFLTLDQLAFYT